MQYSVDYGLTWQNSSPLLFTNNPASALAMSGDGQYGVVGHRDAGIYVSSNYGVSWTPVSIGASPYYWGGLAISDSGSIILAAEWNYSVGGSIWRSTDYGSSWTITGAPTPIVWIGVECDSTCTRAVGISINSDYLYLSTDSGVSWTPRLNDVSRQYRDVQISGNGSRIVAITDTNVFLSKDGGDPWTNTSMPFSPFSSHTSLLMSKNGTSAILLSYGYPVYYNANLFDENLSIPNCTENWLRDFQECVNYSRNITYTDLNSCGTFVDLPLDNGTSEYCCFESWTAQYTACLNNSRTLFYLDANMCETYDNLPLDNGTVSLCGGGINWPEDEVVAPPLFIGPVEATPGLDFVGFALLFEKLFSGELSLADAGVLFTDYIFELLITVVGLALLILAGMQFTTKSRKKYFRRKRR